MSLYFWIFLRSGLARFALSGALARDFGETFPSGTFIIHVSQAEGAAS
jgi:hypothetical protein